MKKSLTPAELRQRLAQASAPAILDVRRKADFDADTHMLPNALWCDPEQLEQWSATLPKGSDVVVYCVRGGAVSNEVIDHLRANSHTAHFIEGGINAWKESGGRVTDKSQG
jgi:rhodanese-related sulfurtransferase